MIENQIMNYLTILWKWNISCSWKLYYKNYFLKESIWGNSMIFILKWISCSMSVIYLIMQTGVESHILKYVLSFSSFSFVSPFIIFLHFIPPNFIIFGIFLNVLISQLWLVFSVDVMFCVTISSLTVHFQLLYLFI